MLQVGPINEKDMLLLGQQENVLLETLFRKNVIKVNAAKSLVTAFSHANNDMPIMQIQLNGRSIDVMSHRASLEHPQTAINGVLHVIHGVLLPPSEGI